MPAPTARGRGRAALAARPAAWRLAALMLVLVAGHAGAEEFRRLNGTQIRALLAGRDVTDTYHADEFYRRDGVLVVTDPGSDTQQRGRWTVERDQICTANSPRAVLQCFQVWRAGDALSLRRREQDRPPLAYLRDHIGR